MKNHVAIIGKGPKADFLIAAIDQAEHAAFVGLSNCKQCGEPLTPSTHRYCTACYDAFMAAHPELSEDA